MASPREEGNKPVHFYFFKSTQDNALPSHFLTSAKVISFAWPVIVITRGIGASLAWFSSDLRSPGR